MKKITVHLSTLLIFLASSVWAQETPILSWARAFVGGGAEFSSAVAFDAAGNVYTAGSFANTIDFDPGAGVYNLTSAGFRDIYISKLDANGNFVWARSFGGNDSSGDFAEALTVDGSGNVLVLGFYSATIDFDPGPGTANLTPPATYGAFILKLTTDGNFVWAKQTEGTGSIRAHNIITDNTGNVYIGGGYFGTLDFDPGPAVNNLTPVGGLDAFVLKLNANGDLVWARSMGGTDEDEGYELAVDPSGNVFSAGHFRGTVDLDPGTGSFPRTAAASDFDEFFVKLDISGSFVWARTMGSQETNFRLQAITSDPNGNLYATGHFQNTVDFDPGVATLNITSSANLDIFVLKLDDEGDLAWAKTLNGNSGAYAYGITTDNSGNVFYTGAFYQTMDFDPGAGVLNFTAHSFHMDLFTSKLDPNGNLLWAGASGGSSDITGYDVEVDPTGNVYVTGQFYGTIDFDFTACTSNLTALGSGDAFVEKITVGTVVPPPTITSFSPTSGAIGSTITITGTNFGGAPTVAFFNNKAATIISSTPTSITTTVPAGTTSGKISVTANCVTVASVGNFTVGGPPALVPTITSFTPTSGPRFTIVTITGTNFSATAANNIVTFNGEPAFVVSSTTTTIMAEVPSAATTGKISVTVSGNTAVSATDFVVPPNQSPTIESTVASVPAGGTISIPLEELMSDPEGDLNLESIYLLSEFTDGGAPAIISGDLMLILDYSGIAFTGTDHITIGVCDLRDACTEQELTIEVGGEITIYNAVSPNNDGKNEVLWIEYIDTIPDAQSNKVTIYNRWGSMVSEISDYNNSDRVFSGVSSQGNDLPSGVYYYKVEFTTGRLDTKTGYLRLTR